MMTLMERAKAFLSGVAGKPGKPNAAQLQERMAGAELAGVRSAHTGYPADGLTPWKLGQLMKQADQGDPLSFFELAEQAEERDTHYLAVLAKRKRQVAKIPVRVEAASNSATHKKHADLIEKWLKRESLQLELFHMLDAVGKGISFTEIIWDRSKGYWWPQKLEWCDPRFFTFSPHDLNTPLLRETGGNVELPPFKFIVTRIQSKSGLSIRSGVARAALWVWLFKMMTAKGWAVFMDGYGHPVRLGKFPNGASEEDKKKLLTAVRSITADFAAIIPDSMLMEFLETKSVSQSGEHFERRCNFLDQQISKVVLGQTATTDAIAGGHAVGKEHREVEKDLAESDAQTLQSVLNEQFVTAWIDLEFGPQEEYPRLVIEEPDETDIPVFVKAATDLSEAGLRVSKKQLYDKTGLVEPESDDDVLVAKPKEPPPALPPPKGPLPEPAKAQKFMAVAGGEGESEEDIADALEQSGLDDWQALVSPVVAQVRRELSQATSLEDFRTRLQKLAGEVDVAALTQALQDASVTATIAGLAGVPRVS